MDKNSQGSILRVLMCIYQPAFIFIFDQLILDFDDTATIRGRSILKFHLDNLIQIAYRKLRSIL